MSNKGDEELNKFIEELETSAEDVIEFNTHDDDVVVLPPIQEDEFEEKLMSGVAMLLDSCNQVAHNLKNRIKSGDNYEGVMMGFAQSTDNTIKALKIIENRRLLKLKEEVKLRELELQHQNRLELEDKKNEGKALSNVKSITQNNNTFHGSVDDFYKKIESMQNPDETIEVDSEVVD